MRRPLPFSHPSLAGPLQYEIHELSADPDEQVAQTIGFMRRYACEDSTNPLLLQDVRQAWQSTDPLTDTWNYLRRDIGTKGMQFVRDEKTAEPIDETQTVDHWSPIVEVLIRPQDQIRQPQPQGDCDDFAMLGAAHLKARGVPCCFVTVAADRREPDQYSHVYLVAYPKSGPFAGMRVPLDLSHGSELGWEVPNIFGKRTEWPVEMSPGIGSELFLAAAIAGAGYLIYRGWKKAA